MLTQGSFQVNSTRGYRGDVPSHIQKVTSQVCFVAEGLGQEHAFIHLEEISQKSQTNGYSNITSLTKFINLSVKKCFS